MGFAWPCATKWCARLPFAGQCAFARPCGYDGIELAPFTLCRCAGPHLAVAAGGPAAGGSGGRIAISGLHWLLVAPPGLALASEDRAVRERSHAGYDAPPGRALRGARRFLSGARQPGAARAARGRGRGAGLGRGGVPPGRGGGGGGGRDLHCRAADAGADQLLQHRGGGGGVRAAGGLPGLRTMVDTCSAAADRGSGRRKRCWRAGCQAG